MHGLSVNSVDEKERAADRDPEKELADSGFHDYQRPWVYLYTQPLSYK